MTEQFDVPERPPDYADVFSGPLHDPSRSARQILEHALSLSPRWFLALHNLRNKIVQHFGLKTAVHEGQKASINDLSQMPVVYETDTEFASGLTDKHLDFMLTVKKSNSKDSEVSITTQIWFNATIGKVYLIAILPIHKRIIKYYIRQLGKPQ